MILSDDWQIFNPERLFLAIQQQHAKELRERKLQHQADRRAKQKRAGVNKRKRDRRAGWSQEIRNMFNKRQREPRKLEKNEWEREQEAHDEQEEDAEYSE
ncbi:uncharacterized protein BDW43DRAFT_307947 [Aspergillus alliaceus]|uniref:uncharacterized protein n=1 Tax=Petromyces alliaceus TaxID=209559 RepID=UPI0012A4FEA5|nr:uncharacterized protein BDW43DRAFT_307947 [Aspergillus alliaceus]KAB8236934.1 hypothetical protein BDW43DRAFT_307947 [Aspergillus alliaceus]